MDFDKYLNQLVVVQIPDEKGTKFLKGTVRKVDDKFILLGSGGRDVVINISSIISLKETGGCEQ